MKQQAIEEGTLTPRAVYGYFPANSDGNDLILYDPDRYSETGDRVEIARLSFPRQPYGEYLCLADYFAPVGGPVDVCALQVVTVGLRATEKSDTLQAANEYTEAYFFHGMAVQSAEATA